MQPDNDYSIIGDPLYTYSESVLRTLLAILEPNSQRYAEVQEELDTREFIAGTDTDECGCWNYQHLGRCIHIL